MNKQKDISKIVFSGSGGSSDSSKTYVEQSDTLASKQYLRIVDLISEGQIEGLVAGLQSVFLDGTPVQNKDGSENLKGWNIQGRTGSQTQPAIDGFSQVESVKQVGVQVKYNNPIARAIESSDATQVRVSVSIPSLKYTNASSGETGATSVAIAVDLQSNGGAWVPVVFHREDVLSSKMPTYFSQYSSAQINGIQPLINPILCVKYRNLPNTNRQYISYDVKRSIRGAENWVTVDTGVFDLSSFTMAQNPYNGPGQAPSNIGYHVVEKDYLLFHSIESDSAVVYDYKIVITGQSNAGSLSLDLSQSKGKVEFPYDWISGKSSDAFVKDYLINLTGGAPYNIRVRRPVADSTSQLLENDTYFGSYTEIIPYKYRYPNSALMALSVDGSQYSSIPSREYEVKGIRCKIPSTYDPVTRTYSGIWNGSSWYVAWTDNPVWILYDLLTNTRYGLGNKIKPSQIDVAKFYEISQYCDELVDNGFGGKEPRYTCSIYLQGKTKAMQVLADIASVFQGYLYWAGGKLTANYDHPSDPVWLFNNSNVIDGKFTYEGTDKATRYTTALVTYTDRLDSYTQKVEYVEDRDGIVRWGQNTLETTAIGCMSRGQAHRLGKNILLSNRYLTETVSFKAGIESNAACLLPGDVIQVSDSLRAGKRLGGRLLSATTSTVSLDSNVTIEAGKSYTLHVINPSGDVLSSAVTNTAGETSSLSVTLPVAPQAMSVWILESNTVQAQLFRIISIKESEATLYDISAVAYNPLKYSAIESDISFIPLQISGTSSTSIEAPENVRLSEELYFDAAKNLLTKLNIVVKSSQNPYFSYFKGLWRNNTLGTSWVAIPSFTDPEISIEGMREGEIEVALQAVNTLGVVSSTTYQTYTVKGKSAPPSDVTGFCASVTKGVAYLTWDAFTSNLDIDVEYFVIKHSVNTNPSWDNGVVITTKISAPSTSAVVPAIAGAYLIKAVDSSGNYSSNPAIVINEVSNLEHYNVVEAISEHTTWSGTKDRTQVFDGELRLALEKSLSEWNPLSSAIPLSMTGVGTISGNYTTSVHDLGAVYSCRLTFLVDVYGYSKSNVMNGWVSLDALSSLSGGTSEQYSVDILYRVSEDNITWTQWNNTLSGEVIGRYFQFRLGMRSYYTNTTPSVAKFDIVIDMQDRVDGNENVICSASGITIQYSPAFFSNPAVAIVSQGMETGDYYTITAKSNQGFTIRYFNSSGTGVQRTFDWVAKGYGFKY